MTFRTKLRLIVGSALLALVVLLAGSSLLGRKQTRDLATVESRLVPKLELEPRMEAEFERLRQSMQGAVAAQDRGALAEAASIRERLFLLILSADQALDASSGAALRWAVQGYYEVALDVSRRLIDGETGEALVADIGRMQQQQRKVSLLITRATGLNRGELTQGFAVVRQASERADYFRWLIGLIGLVLLLGSSLALTRGVFRVLTQLSQGFARFATGDFSTPIPVLAQDELGAVAEDANQMAASLDKLAKLRDRHDWLKSGQVGLSQELRGDLDPSSVAQRGLWFLARRINAAAAALYVLQEDGTLRLSSSYALSDADLEVAQATGLQRFADGRSLVGQAAHSEELLVLDGLPDAYLKIRSGLGETNPRTLVLLPLRGSGKLVGVAEFALLTPCNDQLREFLNSIREALVIALEAASSRQALRELLEQTQLQAERLAVQEEELRSNNQELLAQQEDLSRANDELEKQRRILTLQNSEIETAHSRVQQKADELARVSTFKSQFLANMSHELRTPLNSMLLLSHLLAENEAGNLTGKQVMHCATIHSAGEDLLSLINQVLDLAKIEAGRQSVRLDAIPLEQFARYARRVFEPLAAEKSLGLVIEVAEDVPESMLTDQQRVERILTNLLGNAIKFTVRGRVKLRIERPTADVEFSRPGLAHGSVIAFVVSDTGIGIPEDARERVFAPFEQVESTSDRRYAGTGLGLAISRESAQLLGGELRLESQLGIGSTFSCYLPETALRENLGLEAWPDPRARHSRSPEVVVSDDRAGLRESEPHLLIVEDDPNLVEQLVDVIHAHQFKAVVASSGEEAFRLAMELRPRGIILDVKLPDTDGWTVMDRLRKEALTRDIPVHFISGLDSAERGLALGAVGYLTKPATHAELAGMVCTLVPSALALASRKVLVVEDSPREGQVIVQFLAKEKLEVTHVESAGAALAALRSERYACIILDLGLPDMNGLSLLEAMERDGLSGARVVVYTGRALSSEETRKLAQYAETVILKDGSSADRLREEVRLFVQHLDAAPKRPMQNAALAPSRDGSLQGIQLLLADDDMRTVYALSALLRAKGAEVLVAENGREALELLALHHGVQAVLMDLMMPEMDGYEAIRRARKIARLKDLPVIALTASALKGERERCLEAGASDYLTKPVDSEHLLVTLRGWLAKGASRATDSTHA